MLKRVHTDERGVAMIVAIMVSFVVMLLSIFVIDLSIHNSNQSAYDRKRVTSIAVAEAGIDYAWSAIETVAPENLPCATPLTGTVASSPGTASYSVTATYYLSDGTLLTCPMSQTNVPAAVLLTSTGTTNGGVARKMQAYASLTAIHTGLQAAILTNNGTSLTNSFTLNGNTGNDADIYVNSGDLSVSNTPNVYGNIYIPNGTFSQANNSIVHGNVWANGSASVGSTAIITGSLTSSTSTLAGTGNVNGNATAGSTIAGTLIVGGTKYPNTAQGAPPSEPFPYVCWTAVAGVCSAQSASWTTAGYTVHTDTDCTAARTYLTTGTISGDVVERITSVCALNIATNDVVNFNGNLSIFTDGSIVMANQNNWNGVTGKNLYFIVNYRSGLNCASGSYNVSTGNNSNFNNVNVSMYSPCTVTVNNLNNFSGQLIGSTVNAANNFTMNFRPVLIPGGAEKISGFHQSIVYLREVQ